MQCVTWAAEGKHVNNVDNHERQVADLGTAVFKDF